MTNFRNNEKKNMTTRRKWEKGKNGNNNNETMSFIYGVVVVLGNGMEREVQVLNTITYKQTHKCDGSALASA